jgi:hypothetical protein
MSFFRKLIDLGRKNIADKHDQEEAAKPAAYRVGSGGIYYEGTSVGTCHRVALARFFGVEQPISDDKHLMFSLGLANEDLTVLDLEAANDGTYKILREEECPISWTTDKGTPVTGRPDIVISQNDKLIAGLELKSVSSLWTARDVCAQRKPKLPHLIQAGHYMSRLNIPFELLYISRVNFAIVGDWVKSFFSKNLNKSIELNDKGEPKNVNPFDAHFELQFNTNSGDVLCYRSLESKLSEGFTPTIVTKENIDNYFAFLDYLREQKDLGPRPMTVEADGTPCKGWNNCSYCEFKPMCDKSERNYDRWFEDIKKVGRIVKK